MSQAATSSLTNGFAHAAGEPAVPLVSVVVPVRDNGPGVRQLIKHLEAQTLPRACFEVLIGDDGSRDDLRLILATEDGWVRVERGSPHTSYSARNRAARAAVAPVLAFCDSDCLPDREWLARGLAALEQADVVAGEVSFVAPEPPNVWSLLTVDTFLDQERNVASSVAVTANLFVRRALFESLGGFDTSLPSGGDYDFAARAVDAGARLVYAHDAVVRHPTLDDRRAFFDKVWYTNRWWALRMSRDRRGPKLVGWLTPVPILGTMLERREMRRSVWRVEPSRLHASGLRADWRTHIQAMSLVYFFVTYVALLARLWGRFENRLAPGRVATSTETS